MKVLAVDGRTLVSSFYNLFMRDDPQVDTFIQEIQLCIEKQKFYYKKAITVEL